MKKNLMILIFFILGVFLPDVALGKAYSHPRHRILIWRTRYKGTIYKVIKLPHCKHLRAFISYSLPGETKEQAKRRLQGVAACTGCFYNSDNLRSVDYLRRNGKVTVGREVGRPYLAILKDGVKISKNYQYLNLFPSIDAVALGQSLVPFEFNGFSLGFNNLITDRMALGISKPYIYIIQGKSNLWHLSQFAEKKLYCQAAINADGGHAVKGKSPYHIIFKWQKRS